jgi:hypothetical protein
MEAEGLMVGAVTATGLIGYAVGFMTVWRRCRFCASKFPLPWHIRILTS